MAGYPNKSFVLLEINNNSKWELNEEAVYFLKSITTPIFVISIVGKYRTGKSYFMSRIAGKTSAFATGATTEPVTKGIWALLVRNPKLPNVCQLLLDTEGLNNTGTDRNIHDTHVFIYSLLVSHVLMFNADGAIDCEMLNQLHFMSGLSNHINVDGNEDIDNLKDPPSLFFVLRNWHLKMSVGTIKDREATPDEYLDDKLTSTRSCSGQNTPAEYLLKYFPERRCFAIPKPVEDEKLNDLENVPDRDLKPLFLQRMDELSEALHDEVRKTENLGNQLTGNGVVSLLRECVITINSSEVLRVAPTFDLMAAEQCRQAKATSLINRKTFETVVKLSMPLSTDELRKRCANFLKEAMEAYCCNAVFKKGNCFDETREELKTEIEYMFHNLTTENEAKSELEKEKKTRTAAIGAIGTVAAVGAVGAVVVGIIVAPKKTIPVAAAIAMHLLKKYYKHKIAHVALYPERDLELWFLAIVVKCENSTSNVRL